MLEEKIGELTISINLLNETLLRFESIGTKVAAEKVEKVEDSKPIKKTLQKKTKKTTAVQPREEINSELQAKCLAMVREDRGLRDQIKDLISSYDAKIISGISDKKIQEFKEKLEGLK